MFKPEHVGVYIKIIEYMENLRFSLKSFNIIDGDRIVLIALRTDCCNFFHSDKRYMKLRNIQIFVELVIPQ